MGAIARLVLNNTVTAATSFAVDIDGQDQRVLSGTLKAYLDSISTDVNSKTAQYEAPSATGFSVQITDGSDSIWLRLTPTAGFAAGTIVMPASSNAIENQEVLINCTQIVTTLTMDGNGATVTGAPTTLAAANAFFTLKFDSVTTTWYRVS